MKTAQIISKQKVQPFVSSETELLFAADSKICFNNSMLLSSEMNAMKYGYETLLLFPPPATCTDGALPNQLPYILAYKSQN